MVLMVLERRRAPRPSDLGSSYLIASILCDVVILCTRTGVASDVKIMQSVQLRCFAHFVTLIFEACTGLSDFDIPNSSISPEESRGVFSRVFFTWINPILLQGYRRILVGQDLPCLSEDMKPEVTREGILHTWSQRG